MLNPHMIDPLRVTSEIMHASSAENAVLIVKLAIRLLPSDYAVINANNALAYLTGFIEAKKGE